MQAQSVLLTAALETLGQANKQIFQCPSVWHIQGHPGIGLLKKRSSRCTEPCAEL